MKTQALTIAAIAASLAGTVFAQPGEIERTIQTIEVAPIRDAATAKKILERERGNIPQPKLTVGMKAPKLAIADWVKGESVRGFEKGHTYIVEFWAEWCGPCIRAFPHLSEIQEKYKDDLTVIGVNIWDRKKDRATGEYKETMPDQIKRIRTFVEEQGDKMAYTVAIEETGKMAEYWMRAAGKNGIPAAFVVDGDGIIAWSGHPMNMDKPLEEILAGKWDIAEAKQAEDSIREASYWYPHTMKLLSDESTAERGYQLAYALLRSPAANNPRMLNAMSWNMLTSDKVAARNPQTAIAIASVACEKTNWEDPSIIDTLARGFFEAGNHDKAISLQNKAIGLVVEDEKLKKELTATLEKYKAGSID